jgi:hypothetical protein
VKAKQGLLTPRYAVTLEEAKAQFHATAAPRFRTIQFCPKDVGSACSHSPTRLRAAAFD